MYVSIHDLQLLWDQTETFIWLWDKTSFPFQSKLEWMRELRILQCCRQEHQRCNRNTCSGYWFDSQHWFVELWNIVMLTGKPQIWVLLAQFHSTFDVLAKVGMTSINISSTVFTAVLKAVEVVSFDYKCIFIFIKRSISLRLFPSVEHSYWLMRRSVQ